MAKTPAPSAPANRLLARLPRADYERLVPNLQPVQLKLKQVLYEPNTSFQYAYFLDRGIISLLLVMEAGSAIEVATIGNEGMMGLPVLMGVKTVPYRYFMQSDGQGYRMRASAFGREVQQDGPLRELMLRYNSVFLTTIMRVAGCNGLHKIQERCCRWILQCQDRVQTDVFPLTHEFLALMLGVRRASVTDVLRPLAQKGMIRCGQGTVTVVDRKALEGEACECYQAITDEYDRLLN